ncbi:hypothetical protein, partial [Nocardia cyriacigeorgica]|uniref:hypothetical protein n=1 Tax=Nocardia cyriacigeorgica TaxID=135487 RepID=UPI002458A07C
VEVGHHVFPGLDERISHRLIPPPSAAPLCATPVRDRHAPDIAAEAERYDAQRVSLVPHSPGASARRRRASANKVSSMTYLATLQ